MEFCHWSRSKVIWSWSLGESAPPGNLQIIFRHIFTVLGIAKVLNYPVHSRTQLFAEQHFRKSAPVQEPQSRVRELQVMAKEEYAGTQGSLLFLSLKKTSDSEFSACFQLFPIALPRYKQREIEETNLRLEATCDCASFWHNASFICLWYSEIYLDIIYYWIRAYMHMHHMNHMD